ncbi:MAG: ATP-binding protein [candidate division WOR-3 bacterium]|nr:ATP-binding protein [candidate division WOR-3 bacterium]
MIKRYLLNELRKHLHSKEISFIIGPRQAGKTTLMMQLQDELRKEGERTLFLNLDIETDKIFFTSQMKLLKKIELEIGKGKGFVFIDEIQRKEDAGVFLKGIYDMNTPYKFIVSGSGSVELKERIHESLAGRKRVFELYTLSFDEFVDFKTDYKYSGNLFRFYSLEVERLLEFLEEYINFGGYPRVVLESELNEKRNLIGEIFQSYIERDITYLLRVHKPEAFSNLVRLLAGQIGRLVNYTELSSTLGISVNTIKEYLWYLEKTFIIRRINPFFRNVRKEITKSPIYYFGDLGMRNFATGSFGTLTDPGFLFQNFIYNTIYEQIKGSSSKICFWRTKDKAEVDFVIDSGRYVYPVEVKYKQITQPEIPRALKNFIEKYKPTKAFVVNLTFKKRVKLNKTTVHLLPFYEINRSLFE